MTITFSSHPGCRERHLQRRYNNPLFSHYAHEVTQKEAETAQQHDEEERQAFATTFREVLQDMSHLEPKVEIDTILKLKEKIDGLYEKCAGLGGGNLAGEKEALKKLNELIMQSLYSAAQGSPFVEELKKEETAREMHFSLLEYSFIAHLLHPDSPIEQNDIVPTLLTEEEKPLQAAMTLFAPEQQKILCDEAKRLLTNLKEQGYHLPIAWSRLETMEQAVKNN